MSAAPLGGKRIPPPWLRAWYQRLIAPRSGDEDSRREEYILNIVLVTCIGALLALEALMAYHRMVRGAAYTGIPLTEFSVFPVFFIFLHTLSRRGHRILASYLLVAALLFGNAYAQYLWGVDLPITLLVYAFIISTAGILLGTAVGFGVTTAAAAIISLIWSLHIHGIAVPRPQHATEDDALGFGAFYFLIMTISWLSNREIAKSLARARSSEKALAKERDLLEMRVEERTEELRRIQFEELERMHRLAEFGQLASGLFHDLLNILNAISLRTEGSREDEDSLSAAYETTRQIQQFMRAVQTQLGKTDSREAFSLQDVAEQAIQLVSYKANKEGVRIFFECPSSHSLTYVGIPFKFHQVVVNLLMNAIDAYQGIPRTRSHVVMVRISSRRDSFILTVKDEGCGIPDSLKDKVFTPFFTTKDASGGAGIGLASVKKIVEEDLLGTISIHSPRTGGTVFVVTFPAHRRPLFRPRFEDSFPTTPDAPGHEPPLRKDAYDP